ncbi:MAG: hypothetical protein R2824_09390 [Saprospiraceae bacterium]|nr:hypothetical protein [Lewinella sp.]
MYRLILLFGLSITLGLKSYPQEHVVLVPSDFKHYIDEFNAKDLELYQQYIPNDAAWAFLKNNIPFFECPDKNIETTYYFRWWTYRKHIRETATGFVITEFLPEVSWSEKYNTIACAAGHHFYEGRWLRSDEYLHSYAKFWFTEGNPRLYSFWAANALWEYYKVSQDKIVLDLLPDLVANYRAWEQGGMRNGHFIGKNKDGLFSTHDDRDGMEMQISGSGKRPTINSYMYGDAVAISRIAAMAGEKALEKEFIEKADSLRLRVLTGLWDQEANFFKTRAEPDDQFADVKELQGYSPWYFNLPPDGRTYEKAWELIRSSKGFNAPYGLTTAEQAHPKFEIAYSGHECLWNGPVWPYATSVTLTALANVLNNYEQDVVTKRDFYDQFITYSSSHRIIDEHGEILPWIDENMNPYTGDWISRTRLKTWENGTWSDGKGGVERGKDYNHSTFCDLLISGLVGIRTQEDQAVVINPLIPDNAWDWFCLDGVRYKGKMICVLYDKFGTKYNRGTGLMVFIDGEMKVRKEGLEKIRIILE